MATAETAIFKQQGFGKSLGIGEAPALVIVDFVVAFDDPKLFGGGNIHAAVEKTVGLLAFFREHRLPVAYTRYVFAEDGSDGNLLTAKVPNLKILTEDNPVGFVVRELTPRPGELMVRKRNASAFFQTDFSSWLARLRVDTLVVTGAVTSGCVRATVVDALGYGYRPIVPTDCVGDRAIAPHDAGLFDMQQKYADLYTRDELIAALKPRLGKKVAAE
ncbi:MAG: isochorismatase family protein [Alphaproteobacteria bacterium]|nr:isochorismatase family protein [Alphaproteobacteria bacterium]